MDEFKEFVPNSEVKESDNDPIASIASFVNNTDINKQLVERFLKDVPLAQVFMLLAERPDEFTNISLALRMIFSAQGEIGPSLLQAKEYEGYVLMGLASEFTQLQALALECCMCLTFSEKDVEFFITSQYFVHVWRCFAEGFEDLSRIANDIAKALCKYEVMQKYLLEDKNARTILATVVGAEARFRLLECINSAVSGSKFLASAWFNIVIGYLADDDPLTKFNAIKLLVDLCRPETFKSLIGMEFLQKLFDTVFDDSYDNANFTGIERSWLLKLLNKMVECTNREYIKARDGKTLENLNNQFVGCLEEKELTKLVCKGLNEKNPAVLEAAAQLAAHICYNPTGMNCGPTFLPILGKLVDHHENNVSATALHSCALVLESQVPASAYEKEQINLVAGIVASGGSLKGIDALIFKADKSTCDNPARIAALHCLKNLLTQEFGIKLLSTNDSAIKWLTKKKSGSLEFQQWKMACVEIVFNSPTASKLLTPEYLKEFEAYFKRGLPKISNLEVALV